MSFAVLVEPEHPILIDKFLENAIEVDVDAIADHTGQVTIGGIMEHIEQAGIILETQLVLYLPFLYHQQFSIKFGLGQWELAKALKVIGLMNIQFAVVVWLRIKQRI